MELIDGKMISFILYIIHTLQKSSDGSVSGVLHRMQRPFLSLSFNIDFEIPQMFVEC